MVRSLAPLLPAFLFGAMPAIAQLRVEPTFTSCSLYVPADTPAGCQVSYRRAGGEWQRAFTPIYDPANREYRLSIVRLEEDTAYELKADLGDPASLKPQTATFRTWTSQPPVQATQPLSRFVSRGRAAELIGLQGTPDAWIRITGDVEINAGDRTDYAVLIKDCRYVILEGAVIKGGGRHGILVQGTSSEVRIVNCDISAWGRVPQLQAKSGQYVDAAGKTINNDGGVTIDRTGRIVVERCYIHDPNGFTNPWNGVVTIGEHRGERYRNAHPVGPNGIYVRQSTGGVVIRHNDITGSQSHRYNDPIETSSNGAVDGGFNRDADIHGNLLAFGEDDGIELDGGQCNVRFFGNRVEQVLCGISTAPNKKGPSYLFQNLVWNLGDSGGRTGAAVKNGGGHAHSLGRQFFFHNTIVSNGYGVMQGVGFGEAGANQRELYHAYTRNNIFMMERSAGRRGGEGSIAPSINDKYRLPTNSFDHDLIASRSAPDGRGVIVAAEGSEQNGIFALPHFIAAEHGVFGPKETDPGIDRGTVVPNFSAAHRGAAPDIGAIELGGRTLMPVRPLDLEADKYHVRLKEGEPQTITLKVGRLGGSGRFAVRTSADMEWLSVEPLSGTFAPGSSVTFKVSARKSDVANKGMMFIRLANGLSVPISVATDPDKPLMNADGR